MTRLILIIFVIVFAMQLQAQEIECELVHDFFEIYKENCNEAIDFLEQNNQDLNLTRQLLKEYKSTCELDFKGYQFHVSEKIGKSEICEVYVDYNRQGVIFIFGIKYTGSDSCLITSFKIRYI